VDSLTSIVVADGKDGEGTGIEGGFGLSIGIEHICSSCEGETIAVSGSGASEVKVVEGLTEVVDLG
jgi:hypothetical protein